MNPESMVLAVIDALVAADVPYLVAESLSSSYYGIPRSTQDADFVIELQGRSVMELQRHLPPTLRLDPQIEFETVTATRRNVVTAPGMAFEIKLFRLSDDPHDQLRFQRRRSVALLGRSVSLPTPEDVIITKLRWCDQHGTRTMLEEIRGILPPLGDLRQ